jgi:hypothetical protein
MSAILLTVATFEAFLNIWFRVITERPDFSLHRASILADLDRRSSLRYKTREWPKRVLGRQLDLGQGVGQQFLALLDRRNQLMHFTSSYSTVDIPEGTVEGLADMTVYESLTADDANDAIATIDDLVAEFFAVVGKSPENCLRERHYWLGRVAFPHEIAAAKAYGARKE